MFSKRFLKIQMMFCCVIALLLLAVYLRKTIEPALPVMYPVAPFSLVDSDDQHITLDDLKGKVWVVDFMFTTCSNICPMMTKNMRLLHGTFGKDDRVRLVSISVNPENDSPQALKNYAAKFNADTKRWFFLTGSREDITKVAVESFKLGDIKEPVFHSSYFALVDKRGRIRAYYDGTIEGNMEKISHDLKRLIDES